jgi:hypothetical protein
MLNETIEMSTESVLWGYIRDHVKGPDWVRVENAVGPGTPDVNYSYLGFEGWMELKHRPTRPRTDFITAFPEEIGLRPEQKIWINRRTTNGGVVWIVAGVVKEVYFIDGRNAPRFNQLSYGQLKGLSELTVLRGSPDFSVRVRELLRGV